MKKIQAIILSVLFSFFLIFNQVYAMDIDVSSLSDEELQILYDTVVSEMAGRSLSPTEEITLREGKWIVGQDIMPGTYTITCLESSGENLGSAYSSLGSALDSLDEEDSGCGELLGSLGGLMGDFVQTEIKVLGDYGMELKSLSLKSGESAVITLEEKTALEISGGKCSLKAK